MVEMTMEDLKKQILDNAAVIWPNAEGLKIVTVRGTEHDGYDYDKKIEGLDRRTMLDRKTFLSPTYVAMVVGMCGRQIYTRSELVQDPAGSGYNVRYTAAEGALEGLLEKVSELMAHRITEDFTDNW